jgi:hypothetical protein
MIGHDLLRISAALARHLNAKRAPNEEPLSWMSRIYYKGGVPS